MQLFEYTANVFKCLSMFLEIVSGKEKAIMRIILALAAHFKPNSVKQTKTARSMAGIAQVMFSLPQTFKLCYVPRIIVF